MGLGEQLDSCEVEMMLEVCSSKRKRFLEKDKRG